MTLAELQPHVEQALVAIEWETARSRWRRGLLDECLAIQQSIPLAGQFGIERAPLEARLGQIETDLAGDVTADQVPQHPLRSVPMDLIAAAVARRILKLPPEFPILSLRDRPSDAAIGEALMAIAMRWQTTAGELPATA